ncbi:hypothetical protein K9M74_05530 [Candidatus Woesearchaeota archaeon]|nr:hypothetical protein [Candidatus Woesearchaeota archaeon]
MSLKKKVNAFEVLSGLFLLFSLLIIIITAAIGNHNLFIVVIGFFPTILTILISLTIHEQYAKQRKILWFLPICLLGAFYIIGTNSPSVAKRIDVPVLIGINFILSIFYIIIVYNVFKSPINKENKTETETTVEQTIEDYVHSIEDKSKALNFVVGRVYNKYHGGTSNMREKLRIPADWYNEFSSLGIGTENVNAEQLLDLITRFELQLKNYEKKEFELFKSDAYKLKNLIHDPHGKDKVIAVLDHNDKDPVRSYYEGAVKFCEKVRDAIKHQELNLVKNEYIPKTEEEEQEIKAVNHVNEESLSDKALSYDSKKSDKEKKKKKGPTRP